VYVPGRSSDLRIISPGCAFPPGKEAVASGSRQSPHTAPALKRYGFAPYSLFSADPSDPRHQIQYVRLFMPSGRQKSNILSRSPCFPVVVCKKMEYNFANKTRRISLTRISHKDRCERPESALNTGLQRQKAHRHIEIFRGRFLELYPRRHGAFRPCSRSLVRNAG
jgi:hypothetical protein